MLKETVIHVDGGTAGTGPVGIAAVAVSPEGYFLGWLSRQLPRMTNNEAEYNAALLGLELAERIGGRSIEIVSDSEVVVRQMRGVSRVNSGRLRTLHQQLVQRGTRFQRVTFCHVRRDQNRLADALAGDAIHGRTVKMPHRWGKSGRRRWGMTGPLGRAPGPDHRHPSERGERSK